MPELPEIETIKRGISELAGQTINDLIIRNHSLRYKISSTLANETINQTIISIKRRAKYLILELENGFILIHLGMSGSLTLLTDLDFPIKKHDHFEFHFDNYILRYNDPRRFGMIMYEKKLDESRLNWNRKKFVTCCLARPTHYNLQFLVLHTGSCYTFLSRTR